MQKILGRSMTPSPESQGVNFDVHLVYKHALHAYCVPRTVHCPAESEMNKTRGKSEARISRSKCHSGGTHREPGSQESSQPNLVRTERSFWEGICRVLAAGQVSEGQSVVWACTKMFTAALFIRGERGRQFELQQKATS